MFSKYVCKSVLKRGVLKKKIMQNNHTKAVYWHRGRVANASRPQRADRFKFGGCNWCLITFPVFLKELCGHFCDCLHRRRSTNLVTVLILARNGSKYAHDCCKYLNPTCEREGLAFSSRVSSTDEGISLLTEKKWSTKFATQIQNVYEIYHKNDYTGTKFTTQICYTN